MLLPYYEVRAGQGPYALMLHGFLSSRAQWLPNLEALSTVCRPVVVELFGHGRSPAPDDPYEYAPERYVEAFERIREALGVADWFVIGQSLGAGLTLRYVLAHPDRVLAHLVTNSSTAFSSMDWVREIRPGTDKLIALAKREGRLRSKESPSTRRMRAVWPRNSNRRCAQMRRATILWGRPTRRAIPRSPIPLIRH